LFVCDRCQIKLNPDNLGFKGDFLEFYERENIHFCVECSASFQQIYTSFINNHPVMRLVDNKTSSGGAKKKR
jgi:hypothetical protein